ncbi:MAG TPA: DNA cytosine methyltransferase [Candidatus Thermoplasmatota archaeon]|nr:DNA cytosine methyltransferase [Candidatus Thermoplasmatota archaeon]
MKFLTKDQVFDKRYIQKTLSDYQKNIRAVDLFCGCGGFSLGFIQAGINVVCGVDADYGALQTYWCNLCGPGSIWVNKNDPRKRKKKPILKGDGIELDCSGPGSGWLAGHPEAKPVKALIQRDINDVTGDDILDAAGVDKVECVFGSPPCQSFSQMSSFKKTIGHPLDYLCFEFARIILELNPDCIAMENVPPFVKKKLWDGRRILDVFIDIIENHNWELYYEIKYNRWWHENNIKPMRIERIQISNDDLPEGIMSVVEVF